eukprot:g9577.t1
MPQPAAASISSHRPTKEAMTPSSPATPQVLIPVAPPAGQRSAALLARRKALLESIGLGTAFAGGKLPQAVRLRVESSSSEDSNQFRGLARWMARSAVIAQRDRQLALLPDRRSQDGFVRCVGQTCFPGEDAEGMKADLAECKKHCQDRAYGAFVVQGDGRAYFKRQKVGDCRRNLEPEAFSTTYLHYSVEVAKLCSDLQHAAAAQQRWSRPTAGPSAFAASAAEARLRRTAQQCMELTRNVQALEEALQHQLEATDERAPGSFQWPEASQRPRPVAQTRPHSKELLAQRQALLETIGLGRSGERSETLVWAETEAFSPSPCVQGAVVDSHSLEQENEFLNTFPVVQGTVVDVEDRFVSGRGHPGETRRLLGDSETSLESSTPFQWPGLDQSQVKAFSSTTGSPSGASPNKEMGWFKNMRPRARRG